VLVLALVVVLSCAACGQARSGAVASPSNPQTPAANGARRPPDVYVPPSYDPRVPMPLLVVLHGYTSNSQEVDRYFQLQRQAAAKGLLYVRPNGTTDASGEQFWNATDACCDLYGTGVDDSAYLAALISDLESRYAVDRRRVYVVGHSNGGFMAYRMACDHADVVAVVVSFAGAMPADRAACKPSGPVSVLQVHGTADTVVPYGGGAIDGRRVPAARTSVEDWAVLDGCDPAPTPQAALDVAARSAAGASSRPLAGAETSVLAYGACKSRTVVQLWVIDGGSHVPDLSPSFAAQVTSFLLAHPKA
jgi:polyhydroxybutyrate depolymerase